MKNRYKFINFDAVGEMNTCPLYACRNNKSGDAIGYVEWYPAWRQWVFNPEGTNIILSVSCMADIADFIGQLKP